MGGIEVIDLVCPGNAILGAHALDRDRNNFVRTNYRAPDVPNSFRLLSQVVRGTSPREGISDCPNWHMHLSIINRNRNSP